MENGSILPTTIWWLLFWDYAVFLAFSVVDGYGEMMWSAIPTQKIMQSLLFTSFLTSHKNWNTLPSCTFHLTPFSSIFNLSNPSLPSRIFPFFPRKTCTPPYYSYKSTPTRTPLNIISQCLTRSPCKSLCFPPSPAQSTSRTTSTLAST